MAKIKISIDNKTQEEIRNELRSQVREIARNFRDEIEKEYLYTIDAFYSEYTPRYYNRHPGLDKTYRTFYKDHGKSRVSAGIIISTDDMYDDYNQSQSDVLSSFLNGYHGHPSLGIWSSLQPLNHMINYRQLLINEIER